TFNKGVIPLGAGAPSLRPIEIDAVIASNSGALLSPAQEWLESVVNEVEILPPKGSVPTKQMLRISTEAKSYQQVVLHLRLYIAVPSSDHSTDDNNMVAIQLVQQCELLIQVSPHHKYNPMADFLLVTNPATTHHHVQAIRTFITDNLNMEVDEWNIGLYGGLSYTAEEGEAATESVLATYRSKTIIFMGNRFEFFNSGTRRITQLCDAQALAENCLHGTSLLFLGSLSDQNYDRLLKNILFPIPFNVASTADGVVPSKSFATKRDLVKSINQQKFIASPAFTAYKLPLKTRWYRFGRASSKAETKAAAKYLRRHLPQDRFLVSSCDSGTSAPGLVVLHGNAHQATVIATESQSLDAVGRPAAPSESAPQPGAANGLVPPSITYPINLQELFLVVASIPISKRIDVAWSDHGSNGTSGIGYSMFALKAVILSLQTDINREVQALLSRGGWPSKLPPAREKHDIPSFLRLHLPILGAVLAHPSAFTADPLPTDLVSLLKHAEASCLPQSKRQVLKSSVVPLSRRQSQLHSLVASAITALLTRKLMTKRDIRLHHHKVRKELHSNFSSEKRNVENMLVRTGSEFTGRTEHEYVESCKTASQLVPKTEYCKGDEWDSRLRAEREVMERVEREYEDARGILGRMILEA
ncbi:hypothetical protein MMC30_000553, partial [Trapelia coarctata]|nr:hypothetical protein [Trapelia coarctata]